MLCQYNLIDTDQHIITTSYTLYVNNQPNALKNYIICKIMQAAWLELSYCKVINTALGIIHKMTDYEESKATQ